MTKSKLQHPSHFFVGPYANCNGSVEWDSSHWTFGDFIAQHNMGRCETEGPWATMYTAGDGVRTLHAERNYINFSPTAITNLHIRGMLRQISTNGDPSFLEIYIYKEYTRDILAYYFETSAVLGVNKWFVIDIPFSQSATLISIDILTGCQSGLLVTGQYTFVWCEGTYS